MVWFHGRGSVPFASLGLDGIGHSGPPQSKWRRGWLQTAGTVGFFKDQISPEIGCHLFEFFSTTKSEPIFFGLSQLSKVGQFLFLWPSV